jgi:hypothetical protein
MATLTAEEIKFLASQEIAVSQVFDASSCKNAIDRESQMTDLDMWFYFGGAICRKAGHRLRSKASHCIQCDTSKIAFTKRYFSAGHIYLAYSHDQALAKIGFTKNDPSIREGTLCRDKYANAADWSIERSVFLAKNAGRSEFEIHSRLRRYCTPTSFERFPGQSVEAREIFSCSLEIALQAFDQSLAR